MSLFIIDENSNEVKLNLPWIRLIPEFKNVFTLRYTNKNMIKWDKDTLARKKLTYIYFMQDYTSPIAEWEETLRRAEALTYAGLAVEDIDNETMVLALEKYELLQYEMCRPLKTYRASLRGLEAMDKFLETVDFDKVDKQGKQIYTPNQYTANLSLINKAYDELDKLKKKIDEQMNNSSSIRGSATMGDREQKLYAMTPNRKMSEEPREDREDTEEEDNTNWVELSDVLNSKNND